MMSMEAEIRALRAEISGSRGTGTVTTAAGPPSRSPSQLSSEVKSETGDGERGESTSTTATMATTTEAEKVNGTSLPTLAEWEDEMRDRRASLAQEAAEAMEEEGDEEEDKTLVIEADEEVKAKVKIAAPEAAENATKAEAEPDAKKTKKL